MVNNWRIDIQINIADGTIVYLKLVGGLMTTLGLSVVVQKSG